MTPQTPSPAEESRIDPARRTAADSAPSNGAPPGEWLGLESAKPPTFGQVAYPDARQLAQLSRSGVTQGRSPGEEKTPIAPILGHLIPGAESCIVFLPDQTGHRLRVAAAVHLSQGFVDALARFEESDGLVTAAAQQARPHAAIYLPGNRHFLPIWERAHEEGVRTLWMVPWRDGDDHLLGCLLFASGQAFTPGKQALAAAALLTEWLATALPATGAGAATGAAGESGQDATARSEAPRDAHGIPVIYDSHAQRPGKQPEPDVVSVLSHELLSPLTLIKGYAATLAQLSDVITRDQSDQYLRGIQSATDRVIRLLENLRDLSRLELTTSNLVLQPTHLPDLLRETIFETQSQTKKHVIRPHTLGRVPQVRVDRQKMEQVITNLLGNAIKYSPNGGDVEASIQYFRSRGGLTQALGSAPAMGYPCVVVTVTDSGPGIPPAEVERIFERFYRIDNRLTRVTSGAGLGLHICRLIVEAHGGRIWASSHTKKGSAFSLSIPVD